MASRGALSPGALYRSTCQTRQVRKTARSPIFTRSSSLFRHIRYRAPQRRLSMGRGWLVAAAGLCLAGCISPRDERVQQYNDDGVWLFQQRQYAKAGEDFQAALDLKPNDAALSYNLGESY